MGKYYYCKICGTTTFPDETICRNCKNHIIPCESLHDAEYYQNKSILMIGNPSYARQILIDEEIAQNPYYNPNTIIHNAEEEYNEKLNNIFSTPRQDNNANVPKCPTCSSTNISKISTASKVTGFAMFGILSTNARSQFKCNNCGYKW